VEIFQTRTRGSCAVMSPRPRKFPRTIRSRVARESPLPELLAAPLLSAKGIESATSGLARQVWTTWPPPASRAHWPRASNTGNTLPCRRTPRHIARERLLNSHVGQPPCWNVSMSVVFRSPPPVTKRTCRCPSSVLVSASPNLVKALSRPTILLVALAADRGSGGHFLMHGQ